jgi:hypothetical protein
VISARVIVGATKDSATIEISVSTTARGSRSPRPRPKRVFERSTASTGAARATGADTALDLSHSTGHIRAQRTGRRGHPRGASRGRDASSTIRIPDGTPGGFCYSISMRKQATFHRRPPRRRHKRPPTKAPGPPRRGRPLDPARPRASTFSRLPRLIPGARAQPAHPRIDPPPPLDTSPNRALPLNVAERARAPSAVSFEQASCRKPITPSVHPAGLRGTRRRPTAFARRHGAQGQPTRSSTGERERTRAPCSLIHRPPRVLSTGSRAREITGRTHQCSAHAGPLLGLSSARDPLATGLPPGTSLLPRV